MRLILLRSSMPSEECASDFWEFCRRDGRNKDRGSSPYPTHFFFSLTIPPLAERATLREHSPHGFLIEKKEIRTQNLLALSHWCIWWIRHVQFLVRYRTWKWLSLVER
ncbi:hypothetical protein CEXT_331831 [Caerostris extrusa]|uniref:Uncharacterized protein n=1 Tax=Caerostris extrusa TaxID=172846 RepID=A0AAV4M281_CAEEX|nr:hypothetical protein CEXT_331831 [Caerostris extrusa]